MILTDYHDRNTHYFDIFEDNTFEDFEKNQRNAVVRLDIDNIDLQDDKKLIIFCIENNRKKVKKTLNKIFGDMKYSLYIIPKIVPTSYLFPLVNKLFSSNKIDNYIDYLKFLHTINVNKNVLFITDFNKWISIAKKNKKLFRNINKLPEFWSIICLSEKIEKSNKIEKAITFDGFMNKRNIIGVVDNIDWSTGVFINSNIVREVRKKNLYENIQFKDIFCLTDISQSQNKNILRFDATHYCNLNFDLRKMDSKTASNHFIQHGWNKENRMFRYPFWEDIPFPQTIPSEKPVFILLNHSETLTGAPCVLFNLFVQLLFNENIIVYMFTPRINQVLLEKIQVPHFGYGNIVQFFHNPLFIEKCIDKMKPHTIIVNSFSSEFVSLEKTFNSHNTIQYVHETFEHYIPNQISMNIDSKLILCADHQTMKSFKKNRAESDEQKIKLLPPKFLPHIFDDLKLSLKPIYSLIDVKTLYKWTSKPLVGMVGTPSDRKNFDLFIKISKQIPEYEFVWIGGDDSYQERNLTVVAQTKDVLSYIYTMNCFLLTSKVDLCPVVLLEALALNIPSLIFQKNIGFKHEECDSLFIVKKNIEKIKIEEFRGLISSTLQKSKHKPNNITGNQYISDNFVYKEGEFIELLRKKAKYSKQDKNKLKFSKTRYDKDISDETDSLFI